MTKEERGFIKIVWEYYRREGRHDHPWRRFPKSLPAGRQAYRILVSETMLQQTQVDRVVPKYKNFLKKFPSPKALAGAPLGEVLREWQGLGYNRRAKMLHETAKIITNTFRGLTPKSYEELVKLPGVGAYTAGAVMAFAYNKGVPLIETNIRTVFIHHFFCDAVDISDKEILQLTGVFLQDEEIKKNPREWYYALMDYGMFLKKTEGNLNNRSKHYTKQSTFKNSDRQIRGAILKLLSEKSLPAGRQDYSRAQLLKKLPFEMDRIDVQILKLSEEGLVKKEGKKLRLP